MSIFNIPLDSVSLSNIQSLIDNNVPEGRQIEYKQILKVVPDFEKKEFLYDISSFATASGGDIVYGIIAEKGIPIDYSPMSIKDLDSEKLKIEQLIKSCISPRINCQIRAIEKDTGHILIIRIFKLFSGPAMVIYGGIKFYSRNSAGKYPLDYQEIKNSFISADSVKERFIKFRNSRIDYFLSAEEGNFPTNPFLLFYISPINEFETNFSNITKENLIKYLWPLRSDTTDFTYNFDGFKTFVNRIDSYSHLQLFQNFTTEIYDDKLFSPRESNGNKLKIIYLESIENILIKKYNEVMEFYKINNIIGPFIINSVWINMENSSVNQDLYFQYSLNFRPNNRKNLMFPEYMVESEKIDGTLALKKIFDDFWRVYGVSRSHSYNENGIRRI